MMVTKHMEKVAAQFPGLFRKWDKIWAKKECPFCHATGRAPCLDGRTECGFCV